MRAILAVKSGRTFLPEEFRRAHELCFLTHDALARLVTSAEEQGVFMQRFSFRDDGDRRAFDDAADVFAWFDATGRDVERAEFFRMSVFPALLSDFLHFVYEALESSRKAKLAVTYALLRKPIQETLFLLETIASDLGSFADRFANNPMLLRAQKAGGIDAHRRRISSVLGEVDKDGRFDAAYVAQLRYDRASGDGFDGVCNTAIHLFTEHEAIRTDKMNINFVFSGWAAKTTQWSFLYSRLPYLLAYARCLTEHVFGTFRRSDQMYLNDMDRRLAAATLLWAETVEENYRHPALAQFVNVTRRKLHQQCLEGGWRLPSEADSHPDA